MKNDPRTPRQPEGHEGDQALDEQLRAALAPDPAVARRLVEQALTPPAPERRPNPSRPRLGWVLAPAAVALVAILSLSPRSDSPATIPDGPSSISDPGARDVALSDITSSGSSRGLSAPVLTISNAGGVLEITSSAGPKAILFPGDEP